MASEDGDGDAETVSIAVRVDPELAAAFEQAAERDPDMGSRSDCLRYLIQRYVDGEVW